MILLIGISLAITGQQGGGNASSTPNLLYWGYPSDLQWGGTDLRWGSS